MSQTRVRRGRPKGSGIDDRQRLDAIARLIASTPDMKPTTAIRALGVSDPSVIRRLRDKFSQIRAELMLELECGATGSRRRADNDTDPLRDSKPSAPPRASRQATSADKPEKRARARSIAAAAATSTTRSAVKQKPNVLPPQPAPAIAAAELHVDRTEIEPVAGGSLQQAASELLCLSLLSTGIAATNLVLSAQALIARELVKSPMISLALRQQLAWGEWALGLVDASRMTLKTAD